VASLLAAVILSAVASAAGDTALIKAVKSGDGHVVQELIASGADVNARAGDGSTPLLWAVHNSNLALARVLIAAKAQVDAANDYGITPLLEASGTGNAAIMGLLLKAGANPSLAHPAGETPLMSAARAGSVAGVRLLLARGVDVNAAERDQQTTALMWAAAEGHLDVVDALLDAGADPNRQAHVSTLTDRKNADHPTGGFTALMWAARNGNEPLVRALVARGARVNATNGDGASPAMIAMYNDYFDLAAALIEELGSDPNDGSLYVAVEMRDATTDQFAFDGSRRRPDHPNRRTALDLMKMLLERGADPNKTFVGQFHSSSMPNTDRFDNTPFFRAAIAADVDALKLLLAHGAKVDLTPHVDPDTAPQEKVVGIQPTQGRRTANPNAGRTAAMVAMTGGHGPAMTGGPGYIRDGAAPYREAGSRKPEDALALLLAAGANPNAKGPDGVTLLHQAARAGNLQMIRELANARVDFTQQNADGLTALDVAEGKLPATGANKSATPAGGPRRPAGAASPAEVAGLLRDLMGLPPAPAVTHTEGAQ
jgi:ankyrin repeat protein